MFHIPMPGPRRFARAVEVRCRVNGACGMNCVVSNQAFTVLRLLLDVLTLSAPENEVFCPAGLPGSRIIRGNLRLPMPTSICHSRTLAKWYPGETKYKNLEDRLARPDPELLEQILAEKDEAIAQAHSALEHLFNAKSNLTPAQYDDLYWRLMLLERTAIVWKLHAEALFGFKVLAAGHQVAGLRERVARDLAALKSEAAVSALAIRALETILQARPARFAISLPISRRASQNLRPRRLLHKTGERRPDIPSRQQPQNSGQASHGKTGGVQENVIKQNIHDYWREQCERERHVTVHEKQKTGNELEKEDNSQVVGLEQRTYISAGQTGGQRTHWDEMQIAIQTKDRKQKAQENASDTGSKVH